MDFDLLASRFEVRSEVRSSRFGSIEGSKKLGSVRSEVRLRGGSSAPTMPRNSHYIDKHHRRRCTVGPNFQMAAKRNLFQIVPKIAAAMMATVR